MSRIWTATVSAFLASAVAVLANCGACEGAKKAPAAGDATACCKAAGIYACAHCKTASMKAEKCSKCSADMAKMNVLSVKDGVAVLCPCAGDCKCTIKADDATKCSCGKDVLTVDVKAACKSCPMPADKPQAPAATK